MCGRGGEGGQEYVEECVPVTRGGNVTLPCSNDSIEAPKIGRRGLEREGFRTPPTEGVSRKWRAHDGTTVGVVGYKELSDIGRNAQALPGENEERFGDAVERTFNIPRGEEYGGARLCSFLQGVDVLRKYCIDPFASLVCML
jgi:hypothetical protein